MKNSPLADIQSLEEIREKVNLFSSESPSRDDYIPSVQYVSLPGYRITKVEEWNEFINSLADIDGFVGLGKERIVIRSPWDPYQVCSVFHEPKNWLYLNEIWRMNRVLSNLFPHNFPAIHGIFGFNDDLNMDYRKSNNDRNPPKGFYYTGFSAELIVGNKPVGDCREESFMGGYIWDETNFWLDYGQNGRSGDVATYPFQDVLTMCNELGIPLKDFGFDPYPENFILGRKDLGEYYVDTILSPHLSGNTNWESKQVVEKVNERYLSNQVLISERQLREVKRYLGYLG